MNWKDLRTWSIDNTVLASLSDTLYSLKGNFKSLKPKNQDKKLRCIVDIYQGQSW